MAEGKMNSAWQRRFWGRLADLKLAERIGALVFVMSAIGAMSFCQLGFWPIGQIDAKPVYLMLILAPLFMGAFMFGPLTGALLGLYSGVVLLLHATFFPLDYYEVYFMTPLNTLVLLTFLGGVSGWLFSVVFHRLQRGYARGAVLFLICVALSFAASGLMMVNTVIIYGGPENLEIIQEYLFNSPLGVAVQALVDAVLVVVLCLAADVVVSSVKDRRESDRELRAVFRNWMIIVSAVVFMLASSIIFSFTTYTEQESIGDVMLSEVTYLERQLADADDRDLDVLLDGYTPELDGYVVITDKAGTILATDVESVFPEGGNILTLLGYEEYSEMGIDPREVMDLFFGLTIEEDGGLSVMQLVDENGVNEMEFSYAAFGMYDEGYILVMCTPAFVHADRLGTMTASTLQAILLILAIAAMATVLLNRVVVRRIDETNGTLARITEGNLAERVTVRDTKEFASLSRGINATVAALSDSIAEAEQKNAQELLTAKAIQESALPREFPPFPDIDRFDIYASMKTAKEVGGDFYDFFLIGDDKLGFVMADVSGKGIPAALFMMTAKTQIRSFMEAGLPLGEAIDTANHQLCLSNEANMFVTVYACELNYRTGLLHYVNAGHNPPLLLHDGTWEWIRDVSGMPLGLFDGLPYEQFSRQLEPEDMLYLYTDGVTEAMNLDGGLFGEDRLEETLYSYADANPRSVGVGVRRALTDFTTDCEQSDDITMLILKYGVPPEPKAVMVLPAVDTQLVHVWNFIHEELHRRRAPASVRNPLDIAAEELFVNVCHYAYPDATPENPGEVRIGFVYNPSPPSLTVDIADDGIPYNPLEKPDAVTPDDIRDVPIGGLGILMAKNSVDEMTYRREDGSNILTFRKEW